MAHAVPTVLTNNTCLAEYLAASVLFVVYGQAVQYMLILEALLLSAAVLYGALYWLVLPLRLHDKPLFFDYSDRGTTVRIPVLLITSSRVHG